MSSSNADTSATVTKRMQNVFATCDFIRVIGSLLVVVGHSMQVFSIRHPPEALDDLTAKWPAHFHAGHGVWILFVLSGFFFAFKVQRAKISSVSNVLTFIVERVIRLWPLFAFAHVANVAMQQDKVFSLRAHLLSLGMMQNWLSLVEMPAGVAWSVSVDFQLHLTGLVFVLLAIKLNFRPRHWVFFMLMVLSLALRWHTIISASCPIPTISPKHAHFWNSVTPRQWQSSFAKIPQTQDIPYTYDEVAGAEFSCFVNKIWISTSASYFPFVLGCWLGWLVPQEVTAGRSIAPFLLGWPMRLLTLAAVSVTMAPYRIDTASVGSAVIFMPFVSVVWSLLTYQLFWSNNIVVGSRLIGWASRMTYAVYLFHINVAFVVVLGLTGHNQLMVNATKSLLTIVPLCFACLCPLHYLIERPMLRFYGGGKRDAQAIAGPTSGAARGKSKDKSG